jgi:protoporphyrinogen/coproporphyrinogen III oxidase
MEARPRLRRVVVVGAGISGLAAARSLLRPGLDDPVPIDVTVLEASGRAGGKLRTIDLDGMPVETGADSFVVRKPWAVDLCKELGLEDEVVIPGATGAFVWARGVLVPFPDRSAFGIPSDLGELLRWRGLPRGPKLRALLDLVRAPRKGDQDEALGALLRRRLGPEASRVLVEPLLAGLHAGEPSKLSTLATFPELRRWEVVHGSLIRGAKAAVGAAGEERGRKPIFATVWGGLGRLVGRMVEDIGADRVRLDRPVSAVHEEPSGFMVEAAATHFHADALVLATPAFEAARLLGDTNPEASDELASIPYASTAVVILVYPPGTSSRLPEDGSGFVVPVGERTITACTWVSRKWPNDAFGDHAVVRCFVGRAGDERALELSDDELTAKVAAEVEGAVSLGEPPQTARVVRWNRAMPQYEVGHLDRVARIDSALERTPGVVVTGAAYNGVGIADCIRQGAEAATQVRDYLRRSKDQMEAMTWTS